MKFHEDTIFKLNGNTYGQKLMEIVNIEGKIVKIHRTEYGVIDPKMYKPDLVFELEDKVVIFEFQSSYVDVNDKIRFRFYSALFDHIEIKSKKPIEVHVLSTIENEQVKWYHVNSDSRFPIYIHSLKCYDGDKFLYSMKSKIEHGQYLTEKELLMLSLLCFMKNEKDIEHVIFDSANIITNINNLEESISQFVKGVVLMLCDKFVKDELLNTRISNKVGGKMKIIDDYVDRVANQIAEDKLEEKLEEKNEQLIIDLKNEGYKAKDISRLAKVDMSFVEQTLSK